MTDAQIPAVETEHALDQRQGDALLVLGYPFADSLAGQPTVTRGLLSATRREANGALYVQTDAAINPGNSGSPVVNMRAKLVGVAEGTLRGATGIGRAVATETITWFLAQPPRVSPPPIYQGSPLDIAPTPADLGASTTTSVSSEAVRSEIEGCALESWKRPAYEIGQEPTAAK